MLDYRTEVQHARDRIERLERAIDAAVEKAPARTSLGTIARRALLHAGSLVVANGLSRQSVFLRDGLARLGVAYVIVGHSERRHLMGMGDEMVARTLQAVLRREVGPGR